MVLIEEYSFIIRKTLKHCDDLRLKKYCGDPNIFRGHCYIASEALHHLVPYFKPHTLRVKDEVHWFLRNKNYPGQIVDITSDQFNFKLDYSKSVGRGFLTKYPSKRCVELLKRANLFHKLKIS